MKMNDKLERLMNEYEAGHLGTDDLLAVADEQGIAVYVGGGSMIYLGDRDGHVFAGYRTPDVPWEALLLRVLVRRREAVDALNARGSW